MGWVASPTIPGLNLPPSLSWEGAIPPEGIPAPPEPSLWGGIVSGLPVVGPSLGGVPGIGGGVLGVPAVGGGAIAAPPPPAYAPEATYVNGQTGETDGLAMALLLALGGLAVSRMRGLRL